MVKEEKLDVKMKFRKQKAIQYSLSLSLTSLISHKLCKNASIKAFIAAADSSLIKNVFERYCNIITLGSDLHHLVYVCSGW